MIKKNIFILYKPLPNTDIVGWNISQLCYLHDHQLIYGGDFDYIRKVRNLIISKFKEENIDSYFNGDGCCSEYRNSVRDQQDRLIEILSEEL